MFRDIASKRAPQLRLSVESAGTGGYHIGAPADSRTQEAARRRGYDLSSCRARIVAPEDFERFDLVLAVDRSTRAALMRRAPPAALPKIRLLLGYVPELGLEDVPDPYYGGPNGFEHVLDLIEAAAGALLRELSSRSQGA